MFDINSHENLFSHRRIRQKPIPHAQVNVEIDDTIDELVKF